MSKVVGIDLGTTFSVAAYMENGHATVIPNREGKRLTPSVVAFTEDGGRLVGQLARRQAVTNPEHTIASIKRRMGTDYKVKINPVKNGISNGVNSREYTPQEISSLILQKVKSDAEAYLGEKIEKVVITVPAYFNDRQRQATMEAGRCASLEVLRIINEPTAASLAYGLDREDIHTVLVWDLGGGTFDVSILELGNGVFEVKSVNGNTHLGGDDWDERIVDYLANEFKKSEGIELREDRVALQKLKEASEEAKIKLSDVNSCEIRIPFIISDPVRNKISNGADNHLEANLSRIRFEELTGDLLEKMTGPTRQALTDANLQPEDIDRVVLVGGSTRMPAVQQLVRDFLGKEPYKDINPDEVVAIGAGVQAGILTGQVKEVVLIDVTPLSLGIETQGSIFTKIIERNTTIPTSSGHIFTTARDNQLEVDIHVLQGERALAVDNISLGKFKLCGISLARRGEPQIEVSFDIDANGIVSVSAKDLYTENEKTVEITSSGKLPEDEIRRIIDEAKTKAQEDEKRKEEIQINIQAENMIAAYQIIVEDGSGLLDKQDLEIGEKKILEVKSALASGDNQKVKLKTGELREKIEALDRKVKTKSPVSLVKA